MLLNNASSCIIFIIEVLNGINVNVNNLQTLSNQLFQL